MKYPAYENTAATRWAEIGSIPAHWEARRLKFAVSLRNEKVEAEDADLEYLGLEHIESWTGNRIEDEAAVSDGIATRFLKGDVLFGKLRPYLAKVYLAEREGMATTEALVLTSEAALVPAFLKFLLLSDKAIGAIAGSTYGAKMPRANWEFIGGMPIVLPPPTEQQQIAAFLDWKIRQIDALIAKKKALIEKLAEKRLALITEAVTKGLDPSAPLRDSGIPWLGTIPQHWELKRFSYISRVVRGASPRPAGDLTYFNGDFIPWITVGEITKDQRIFLDSTETMLTEEGSNHSRVMLAGTLVLTNSGATLGVPKILLITGCANDGVVAFEEPDENMSKRFLYFYLSSLTENLRERMKQGGGQPNLNTDIIKALAVPVPPAEEQSLIADYLIRQTQRLDAMVTKAADVIARLTEYRSAMITAATTGKIDVRQIAVPSTAEPNP